MFPFRMNKNRHPLPVDVIHFILLQMVAITFICVMLILNMFDYELEWLRISLLTFTFLATIIYEVVINLWFYRKLQQRHEEAAATTVKEDGVEVTPDVERKGYPEKYLWFLFMLLVDIFLCIYIISTYARLHVYISLVIGILAFYFISMAVRPCFGVNGNRKKVKESKRKQKRK